MKTSPVNLPATSNPRISFHDTSGRARELELRGDGQVESFLLSSLPQESFLSSLHDQRLLGSDPFTALAVSGWQQDYRAGWVPNGFSMVLQGQDGASQRITLENLPDGSRVSSLTSAAQDVQHLLSGESRQGKLVDHSVKESVVLDASPAGLPVYQDGAILFDLPSAFTGGCTI